MSVWVCGSCKTRYSVGAEQCPQCGATDPHEEHEQKLAIPAVTVACDNQDCPAAGTRRRVLLRTAAPGVVERPPLHCAGCGHAVREVGDEQPAADAAQDEQDEREEDSVPKVTVHTGPSHEAAEAAGEEGPWTKPADEADDEQEGSEQPSPGVSSSTSSETPDSSPKTSDSEDPSPAPTTASRSPKARTGASTARSTGGGRKTATGSDDSDE